MHRNRAKDCWIPDKTFRMSNGLSTETEQKTVEFRTKHSEWVMAHDHRRMEKCLEVRLMEFYKVEIKDMAF